MRISKYEFRRSVLRNEMIFKIPQMLNGPIFLTSGVVELLEQLHLTGLGFAKVWEDNPEQSASIAGLLPIFRERRAVSDAPAET